MPSLLEDHLKKVGSDDYEKKRIEMAIKMREDPLSAVKRLFDPKESWVLVPDGSIAGFFDYVPRHLRVGPWNILVPFYLVGFTFAILYYKPESGLGTLEPVYPEPYSNWWYYNVIVGLWMLGFIIVLLWGKLAAVATYTIQSWIYLILRHGLTALAPFLNDDTHVLIKLNEFLRFPALATATITFFFWNFIVGPAIYYFLKSPKRRKEFLLWNCTFKMVQLHVCNIIFAVLNTISVSPRRLFTFGDLWGALVLAFVYKMFYLLVLDRLGIHLYPVFSPRSKFAVVYAMMVMGIYYGTLDLWNSVIEKGSFDLGVE